MRACPRCARFMARAPAVDAIEQTSQLPVGPALEIESRIFADVTVGEVCKNLIHAFFLRDAAKKRTLDGWFPRASAPDASRAADRPISRIGIVGAGVMG